MLNMKPRNKIGIILILSMLCLLYSIAGFEVNVGESASDHADIKIDEQTRDQENIEKEYGQDMEESKDHPKQEETRQAETLVDYEEHLEKEKSELMANMTLEEKVAQLFVVLPEALINEVDCVTVAGEATQNAIAEIPVGGFIYLDRNLETEAQVKEMLSNVTSYSMNRIGVPAFLCIDEEGGSVARLSGTGRFDIPLIETMAEVGQNNDYGRAKEIGNVIGGYLSDFGFNVDFAPVADVLTNFENEVVRTRAFGSDANQVSDMALLVKQGLEEEGVLATYKHFPGHGATAADTHAGYAYSSSTLEELKNCELIPFEAGIKDGLSFIMVGHISLPNITGDNTPASLSGNIINDLLRDQMGYDGIVITDAMNMGAISQQYSSSDAAIKAIQAGADIILMPVDFYSAYQGIINAVNTGVISQERINESIDRILSVKIKIKDANVK